MFRLSPPLDAVVGWAVVSLAAAYASGHVVSLLWLATTR